MKRTTLVFTPVPTFDREVKRLVEAIAEKLPVTAGKKMGEIEVASEDADKVQRILGIHGYSVTDKRVHESSQNKLLGAIELLGEKYQIDELFSDDRVKKVKPPPGIHKRNVLNFVNRKARAARNARTRTKVPHRRDKLDGKIQALDDMLRYLKKKKKS